MRILRELSEVPVGVYPRPGRHGPGRWTFDPAVGPHEFAAAARAWRREGASIVGGCCGVTPDHLAAVARDAAASTVPTVEVS